ncbi:hypothetical protein [Paenibacillus qinlingensis]|nr:hypothetical protein [Paenibacillus qinlingensis]
MENLPIANRVQELVTPLEGNTFEGYKNEDGSVGIKNIFRGMLMDITGL